MRILSSLLLFTLTLCTAATSTKSLRAETPPWLDLIQHQRVSMDSVQQAYDAWFKSREKGKGTYWKLFERWKAKNESIVGPDGFVATPTEIAESYRQQKQHIDVAHGPSTNAGNWRELGPWNTPRNATSQPTGVGRVNALAFDPFETGVLYAGAPDGGLWRGTVVGDDWVQLNSDQLVELGVSAILPDPDSPGVLLVGTGDRDGGGSGMGVWKYDNGQWTPNHEGMPDCIVGRLVSPVGKKDVVLAGTSVGMFRSEDRGNTWTNVMPGLHFKELVCHPTDNNIAYASANGRVYVSEDEGRTWSAVANGLPQEQLTRTALAVSPDEPDWVYALVAGSSIDFLGLYLSTDAGKTFERQSWAETPSAETPNILGYAADGSEPGGQGWYDLTVAVDPHNATRVFCGTVSLWMSENSGRNWSNIGHWGSQIHADHHALKFTPDGTKLIDGNDGGVYVVDPTTFAYEDISDGLGIGQIYRIGQSPTDRDVVLNGFQDNGCAVFQDGEFVTNAGGDGAEVLVDWASSQYQYNSYGSTIRRSTDFGYSFSTIAEVGINGLTESGAYLTPYALDVRDPNTMYLGYAHLWRADSIRGNVQWVNITADLNLSEGNIRAISQSRTNPNVLFIGRSDGTVYKTENAQAEQPNWVPVHDALEWGQAVLDIEVHPRNANIVWLVSDGNVFRSYDGGQTWTNQTRNIPKNSGPRCLAIDPEECEGVYVGLMHSVVYANNTMDEWISFDANLPRVAINELELFSSSGRSVLRAATWGRGLWETPLNSNPQHGSVIADISSEVLRVGDSLRCRVYNGSSRERVRLHFGAIENTYIEVEQNPIEQTFVADQEGVFVVVVTSEDGTDTLWRSGTVVVSNVPEAICKPETQNLGNYTMGIRRVTINGRSFYSRQAHEDNPQEPAGYLDRSQSHVYTLTPREHNIEVEVGRSYQEFIAVFVDANNDGDFDDEGERLWDSPKDTGVHVGTLTVPHTTGGEVVRLRVISDGSDIQDACHSPNYGQVEDYGLRVVPDVEFSEIVAVVEDQRVTAEVQLQTTAPIEASGYMWSPVGAQPFFTSAIGQKDALLNEEAVLENLPYKPLWLYAFVQTSSGTFFSDPIEIDVPAPSPVISTNDVEVEQHTRIRVVTTVETQGSEILTHGVLWGTTNNITLSNAHGVTAHADGQDYWEDVLGGLPPGTQVYVKSYAYTCTGVYYSDAISVELPAASHDQHRNVRFYNIGVTSASVVWTTQTFGESIVSLSPNRAFWHLPEEGELVPQFSSRHTGDEQFVYAGSDNNVHVDGLAPGSEYTVRVFGATLSTSVEQVDTRPGLANPARFTTYCMPEFYNPSVGTHISEVVADSKPLQVEAQLSEDYSIRVLNVHPEDSNQMVDFSVRGSYNRVFLNAWLDANNNQVFEEDERVVDNTELVPDSEAQFSVVIPPHNNALQYRLRLRVTWGESSQPCQDWSWGETEDILIRYPQVVSTPNAEFSNPEFSISPNPAKECVYIRGHGTIGDAVYTIVDVQGRILVGERYVSSDCVDVSALPAGSYFLVLRTKDSSFATRFQKIQ